jgi:hypothetical protein
MVALDFNPSSCAICITSSHWLLSIFSGEIFFRTRSTSISPPPPGIEPSPAFLNSEIASRSGIRNVSAKC